MATTASDVCVLPGAKKNPRQALYQEVINGFIDEGTRSSLSLVVIGETGQGKSTLINGLVGKQIAKEGDEFQHAGTPGLARYQFVQNGVRVDIWDTPGFGMADDPKEEKRTLEEMARDIKQVDLVLYCMRIDNKRWPKRNDKETIKKITETFTKKFWCHCLFVLTFANCTAQHLRPENDHETYGKAFSRLVKRWEDTIRHQIQIIADLSEEEAENIRTVPVGSYVSSNKEENPWELPDREDWFIWFWVDATEQMREAALPSLLQLNRHRLPAKLLAVAEPEDRDQNSVNPVVVEAEVHARPVPGTIPTEVESNPDVHSNDRSDVHTAIGRPQTCTSDDWARSHTSSVDQNIHDEELTAGMSDGGPEVSTEKDDKFEPKKPEERRVPLEEILRNKLNKDSGFLDYAKEYAKKRGKTIPALGHVEGFIEGLVRFLLISIGEKLHADQTEADKETDQDMMMVSFVHAL